MDLPKPVRIMGLAHKRLTRVCDFLCSGLAGTDVDSLPAEDLPQDLTL